MGLSFSILERCGESMESYPSSFVAASSMGDDTTAAVTDSEVSTPSRLSSSSVATGDGVASGSSGRRDDGAGSTPPSIDVSGVTGFVEAVCPLLPLGESSLDNVVVFVAGGALDSSSTGLVAVSSCIALTRCTVIVVRSVVPVNEESVLSISITASTFSMYSSTG